MFLRLVTQAYKDDVDLVCRGKRPGFGGSEHPNLFCNAESQATPQEENTYKKSQYIFRHQSMSFCQSFAFRAARSWIGSTRRVLCDLISKRTIGWMQVAGLCDEGDAVRLSGISTGRIEAVQKGHTNVKL